MMYSNLSLEELQRFCTTDPAARQYVADNFDDIAEDLLTVEPDWDECYDDELIETGHESERTRLRDLYLAQLEEWALLIPNMAVAGDAEIKELETLLGALIAELSPERSSVPAIDFNKDSATNLSAKPT